MKNHELKIIKKIFFATFVIVIAIFFLHPKNLYATGSELQPWCSNTISEYNNPSGIVLTGNGGGPVTTPIPVNTGYCPEPWTTSQPLVSVSGNISLSSSDFNLMQSYFASVGRSVTSQLNQIISACQSPSGNYYCDPRFIAAIWGQESSFSASGSNGENFNCPPGAESFHSGLSCAVASFISYKSNFEQEMKTLGYAVSGSGTSSECKTTDLFTYMMEEYTPIVGASGASNDSQRTSLKSFLSTFIGSQIIVSG